MKLFWSTFLLIFVTELMDKSRLAGVLLATTYRGRSLSLFWGMTLGYALLEGMGVLIGQTFSLFLPLVWLQLAVAILFVGLGAAIFFIKESTEEYGRQFLSRFVNWSPILVSFLTIALFEIADRTQFVVASLAASSQKPLLVFGGAMTALATLNALTVFFGFQITRFLSFKKMKPVTAVIFVLTGFILLYRLYLVYA